MKGFFFFVLSVDRDDRVAMVMRLNLLFLPASEPPVLLLPFPTLSVNIKYRETDTVGRQ